MVKGVIYCAISPFNKKYYGYSLNFIGRKACHKRKALKKSIDNRFYSAIRKYGFENFSWEIIEEYERENKIDLKIILCEREIYWIKNDKTHLKKFGYNMTMGGDGRVGIPLSEETKKKIGLSQKGKIISDKTKLLMSESAKGRTLSKEQKEKISNTLKGKSYEELLGSQKAKEKKAKMSNSMIGKNKGENNGMYGKTPWNKGNIIDIETKNKISKSLMGTKRPKDVEHRKRISEGLKRYHTNKK